MRRGTRDIAAAPKNGAAADAGETHDGEKERRLADPVAPEHGKAAPVCDLERDGVAISGAHVMQREQGLTHAAPRPDRRRARVRRLRFLAAYPRPGSVLPP